jgi:hypothetical protein
MAARIVHFGSDSCNRLIVLQNAGYVLEDCLYLPNLSSALQVGDDPAAVVMSEAREVARRRDAITLVRSRSLAPLILFQSHTYTDDEPEFDLVIPVLTPPKEWLEKIAATIERSRSLLSDSRSIRQQSAFLVRESSAIRQESVLERQRSVRARSNAENLIADALKKSGPPDKS